MHKSATVIKTIISEFFHTVNSWFTEEKYPGLKDLMTFSEMLLIIICGVKPEFIRSSLVTFSGYEDVFG